MYVTGERGDGAQHAPESGVRQLAATLAAAPVDTANPELLVRVAAAAVPAADGVSLSLVGLDERARTLATSDELAGRLAALHVEVPDGPTRASAGGAPVHVPDLDAEPRWPQFAARAVAAGARSMLAICHAVDQLGNLALTFYARRPHGFSEHDVDLAGIVGWLAGSALHGQRQRERAANLEVALATNRHIGSAIGIVMARELLTAEQAFDRLRDASQRQHRKLRDIAEEVIRTGQLPPPE
jgi:hypothetical protein